MEDDRRRHKKDDRKKKEKKKSRSRSSDSRSRSSSSASSYGNRKKSSRNSGYDKDDRKSRDNRDDYHAEDDFRKNPMGYNPNYMMYPDPRKMGGYDMPPQMGYPMPNMGRPGMFPGYPGMPYPPNIAPPSYPRGQPPPLPGQVDIMGKNMGKPGAKPYPYQDPKLPGVKTDKDKKGKEKEETGRLLELLPPNGVPEIFKSVQLSVKNVSEPLFFNTTKKILTDLETKLKDKKIKTTSKEISEYLTSLPEKLKEAEKKDKKKPPSTEQKMNEYEITKHIHDKEDIETLLKLVNVEKFPLENCFDVEALETRESMESFNLLEEAAKMLNATS